MSEKKGGEGDEKDDSQRKRRIKSRLEMHSVGIHLMELKSGKEEKFMRKMTLKEKESLRAGWVCILWGCICWG